jgi:SAM-dependent methyltransferase
MELRLRRTCPVPAATATTPLPASNRSLRARLSGQAARPHGRLGTFLAHIWVRETAAVNDAAMALLEVRSGEVVLEVGFGPGESIRKLVDAGAEVIGIEVSQEMVRLAGRRNSNGLATGSVRLFAGDGQRLALDDGSVDAVLAVHNIYFWPDQPGMLAEIRRVLRPGGRVVIAMRAGEVALPGRFDPAVYRVPTLTAVQGWLDALGLDNIEVFGGIAGTDHVAAIRARKLVTPKP